MPEAQTYTPRTTFVGDKNPFTGKVQSKKRPPAKRKAVIDPDTLRIDASTPYDPAMHRAKKAGKYDSIFEKLPVGGSIVCKPDEADALGQSLRHWAESNKQIAHVKVVRRLYGSDEARVYLLSLKPEFDASAVATRPLTLPIAEAA